MVAKNKKMGTKLNFLGKLALDYTTVCGFTIQFFVVCALNSKPWMLLLIVH